MKLTKLQQVAVGLALILLAVVIAYFAILKTDRNNIEAFKGKNAKLQSDINMARAIEDTANALKEEMANLQAQLDRLKQILPTEINNSKFLSDVKRLANENGIEIGAVSQNADVVDDVIIETPFTFVTYGYYHDFGRFFAQLTNYQNIVNIKGMHFTRELTEDYSIRAEFLVSVYTYREPTEEELKQQMADAKKAAQQRGRGNRGRR